MKKFLLVFLLLTACVPQTTWVPVPTPTPVPTPVPTPTPTPAPVEPIGLPEWEIVDELLTQHEAGVEIPRSVVEAALGKPRKEFTQPVPPHNTVVTWDVASRENTPLSLHVHFKDGKASQFNVR